MYDITIIGAGPAGITAAIYSARKKFNTLVLTETVGGQTAWSGQVENYPGFKLIAGLDLAMSFYDHIKTYSIDLHEQERVSLIKQNADYFEVVSAAGTYRTKTVIIAAGKKSRELGVIGEKDFRNKGVYYCATCDGPLFADEDVAVIGGGNSALDAAVQLIRIAKKVYIINTTSSLTGDPIMKDKVIADAKVIIYNNARVTSVAGTAMVEAIVITQEQKQISLPVTGIFIEIGLVPNSEFGMVLEKNKNGEIIVDATTHTSVKGIFACGDVTNCPDKQIIIAAGEGAKAALAASKYLFSIQDNTIVSPTDRYRCDVCGYIYDPKENNNVSFSQLSDDWVCPECGVGKDKFTRLSV